jgi:Flagellar hook-length control protein FliK
MNVPTNASVVPFAVHLRERRSQPTGWNKQFGELDCTSDNPEVEFQSSGRHPNTVSKSGKRSHEIGRSNQPECSDEMGSEPQKFSSLFEEMESKCEMQPAFPIQDPCNAFEDTDGDEAFLSVAAGKQGHSNVFEALIHYPILLANVSELQNWNMNSGLDCNEGGTVENVVARGQHAAQPLNPHFPSKPQLHVVGSDMVEPRSLTGLVISFDGVVIAKADERNPPEMVSAASLLSETIDTAAGTSTLNVVMKDAEIVHASSNVNKRDEMNKRDEAAQSQPITLSRAAGPTVEKPKLKPPGHGQRETGSEVSAHAKYQSEANLKQTNMAATSPVYSLVPLDGPHPKSAAQQIVENIKQSAAEFGQIAPGLPEAGGSTKTLHVKLQPEGLGEVQVELKFYGGKVHIHLTSDQDATRDILQSDSTDLISEIRKVAPTFEMVDVSFSAIARDEPKSERAGFHGSGELHDAHLGGAPNENTSESPLWRRSPQPSSNSKMLEARDDGTSKIGRRSVRRDNGDAIYL